MQTVIEIAYTTSGYARIICAGQSRYVVEKLCIQGRRSLGKDACVWKKLYGVYDIDKAIDLMEAYN